MVGLLIIIVCVIYSNGFYAAWDLIRTFASGTLDLIRVLIATAIHFPNELGITDWFLEKGVFLGITILLFATSGYILSNKEQKKLKGLISGVLGIISALLTIV